MHVIQRGVMQTAMLDAAGVPFRRVASPRPEAQAGEALIRIAACGLNPLDAKIHGCPGTSGRWHRARSGREFLAADNVPGAPTRFIVSESFALRFFADGSALGKRVSVAMNPKNPFGEMVGMGAAAIPTFRASRVDPVLALRGD